MTKRKISNKIDRLEEERGGGDGGRLTILHYTGVKPPEGEAWPEKEDASHPELVIQPWPEKKPRDLTIAVPNLLPERYRTVGFLIVESCKGVRATRDDDAGGGGSTTAVKACDLWDELTDEDLREEYAYRVRNDEPIPDMLLEHADDGDSEGTQA